MEKLIELLNEWYQERYKTDKKFDRYECYGGNDYGFFKSSDSNYITMYECDVRTKKNGFIKWLVDNKKIDLDKRPTRNKYRLQQYKTELGGYGKIDEYSELLMLLSIQDKPIEFLISILK